MGSNGTYFHWTYKSSSTYYYKTVLAGSSTNHTSGFDNGSTESGGKQICRLAICLYTK